ncbi:aldo/keto reductase [Patulibacter sp.]|uniref:aldo/keto reductase n=1 Tax=Patulibacter sp. TaxID=1912859 RepID=UPI0027161D0D|nr:aldo/keto reductase [Patulibacter sp.]MDO9410357.1 aldo/keto reductase [Patulibacter sp.]
MARLGSTDLDVFPLNLGGNVFGWTADAATSHAVLDAYAEAGGNFVDTADSYTAAAPGNSGGESETIIGEWLRRRGRRDDLVIATKVSQHPERKGLGHDNVLAAAEDSLRRLGTDHIDLYYAHFDDPDTPLEETLAAFDELVRSGKVRHVAGSNYSPERVIEALAIQDREGYARWVALQPHYNLVERAGFEEGGLRALAELEGLAVLPYFALAKGFLTGKYREAGDGEGPRQGGATAYLDDRGRRVLAALDEVAAAHDAPVTAVSIAWLASRPTVTAPIASARNVAQLDALLQGARLQLRSDELAALDAASA